MNKILFLMCIIIIITTNKTFANGGPGESNSLYLPGNIEFMQTHDIVLIKENLKITLEPKKSKVTAQYYLKNNGSAQNLEYYFPITKYDYGDGKFEINFFDNDKKIDYEMLENYTDSSEIDISNYIDEEYINSSTPETDYYKAKLYFKENETKTLVVEYYIDNAYYSWGTSKKFLNEYSDIFFLYDLSKSGYWGNGKAGQFNLTVDYSRINFVENININIGNFKRNDSGIYNYTENDFDFKKNEALSIVYDYNFFNNQFDEVVISNDFLDRVYVSSTLNDYTNNNYSSANLFDNNLNTVWAVPNNGINQRIEFIFEDIDGYIAIEDIGIANGFYKSEKLYYENSRIKKLQLEDAFEKNKKNKISFSTDIIEFDDIPYEQIKNRNYEEILKFIKVGKYIRMTILEVYPGTKYNDLCISEIFLLSQVPIEEKKIKGYTTSKEPLFIKQNTNTEQYIEQPKETFSPTEVTNTTVTNTTVTTTINNTPIIETEIPKTKTENNIIKYIAIIGGIILFYYTLRKILKK